MKHLLFLLGALALAACGPQGAGGIALRDGTFAPPIGVHGVTAGYFTLQNNGPADVLVGASSPAATSVEFHESVMENGMMSMRKLDKVDVPAGGIVSFTPGGKHLMLFGVKPDIAPGRSMTVTLVFEKAGAKEFAFTVAHASMAH